MRASTYYAWERALLMSSYVAAALGTAVLEPALAEAGAAILGRLADIAFPMGASVALGMEAGAIQTKGEARSSDGWRPSPSRWLPVSRSSWRRSPSMDRSRTL